MSSAKEKEGEKEKRERERDTKKKIKYKERSKMLLYKRSLVEPVSDKIDLYEQRRIKGTGATDVALLVIFL